MTCCFAPLFFGLLSLAVSSEEERRFESVYKQGYDSSCGVAVTATLLHTFWNVPVSESDLYSAMIKDRTIKDMTIKDRLDDSGIGEYTISFADMISTASQYGIAGKAYRMDWGQLAETLDKGFSPIAIHYNTPSPHFALLLAIQNNFAFVSDPAQGLMIVNRTVFEKRYSGNALLFASNNVPKDTKRINEIVSTENNRLKSLQQIADKRRVRGM